MLPGDWGTGYRNVWLLASVDQAGLDRDLPKLLAVPAVVHGVSIEPQLAPVRLGGFARQLQLVINGGESGAGARPFHLEWARFLVVECLTAGTAIFVQSSAASRSKPAGAFGSVITPAATGTNGRSTFGSACSRHAADEGVAAEEVLRSGSSLRYLG